MIDTRALTASPAVEGALVYGVSNPMASLISPVSAGLRAGVGGVAIGRFAWASPDGTVLNERLTAQDRLGFVVRDVPSGADWRRVFYDEATATWRIREGFPVTLVIRGAAFAKFGYGATIAQRVYADVLDGKALSGYSEGGELTPWSVSTPAAGGGVAIITTLE